MYEQHILLPLANRQTTPGAVGDTILVNQTIKLPLLGNSISQYSPPVDGRPSAPPGAKFYLRVVSVSGTSPTLGVSIIKKIGVQEYEIGVFTQATAATVEVIDIANCPDEVHIFWVIAGTSPDFEFEVHCSR